MIAIHHIAAIKAKAHPNGNWVELTLTEAYQNEGPIVVTLYFSGRAAGMTEEYKFAAALCDAINAVPAMRESPQ